MTASAVRRLLLLLTLTSLAGAADDPDFDIGVCRQKCLINQPQLNITEQNVCLHLCQDYADAKSKKESEPGGEIQHCKPGCRSPRKIDGRGKKLCDLECGRKEKKSDDDQRASWVVGGWRKGRRIEEICKRWCWDLPAGGVGEIECLKDCFKVYGLRGILVEWKSWRASRWIISED
ncbi:hypothetical protein KSP39_PZI000521 [Platanthera zijinensis]|uniref:Uncharacterized protein n=1 Tax=Platanthera zijinensis TaxID=2320716 RepID=A0AAP0GGW5_9ASPA